MVIGMMSKIPPLAISTMVTILTVALAMGGFYSLTNWRLEKLEEQTAGFSLAVDNKRDIAILRTRMIKYDERLEDDVFADWWAFRSKAEQAIENHEARINRLESRR